MIRKSGLLEFVSVEQDLGHVGGLDELKGWLNGRTDAFSEPARKFGLPAPKGLLLLGVQGCGKTLTAKAIASRLGAAAAPPGPGADLLRADRLLRREPAPRDQGGGERLADGPLDRRDREGPGGQRRRRRSPIPASPRASSGRCSPGCRRRPRRCSWWRRRTASTRCRRSCLRKGRFDEIFFVDLPSAAERRDIFHIHLSRRKRDPAAFDLDALSHGVGGVLGIRDRAGGDRRPLLRVRRRGRSCARRT